MVGFGLLAVFVGNFGQSFFISWYGAEIQKSLDLSAAQYGSVYSAATLLSGLSIMLMGGGIDKMALRKFMILACCGLIASALFMWQANSIAMLFIGLFLLRFCGQGLIPHTAMTAIGRYFSWNRGRAIGFASNGVPLGEMVLPSFAVISITHLGWQGSWLVVAGLIPLLFLPMLLLLLTLASGTKSEVEKVAASSATDSPSENVTEHDNQENTDGSRRTVLRDSRFWRAIPLILAPPFIVTGLFIHQNFVLLEKSWSSSLFAAAFVVYGITHWAGSMVTGSLVDRFSATHLLPFLGAPLVVGLCLGAQISAYWGSYLMMANLGISIGMTTTIFNALWVEVYGAKHLGSIRSLTSSFVILSTSASPVLLGFLIVAGISATRLLYAMAGYALIATLLAYFSYRSR